MIETALHTHQGRRHAMEDAACAWELALPSPCARRLTLIAVCDGVGGHRGGHVASRLASCVLITNFTSELLAGDENSVEPDRVTAVLVRAAEATHGGLVRRAEHDSALAGMATTLVAAAVLDGLAHVIWCGDSRAYLHRNGRSTLLTRDHSLVAELLQERAITVEQAVHHPEGHRITRCLGGGAEPQIDAHVVPLNDGDVLWLCSDGLLEAQEAEAVADQIEAMRRDERPLASWPQQLTEAALAAGSRDNITATCLRYHRPAAYDLPESTPTVTGGYASQLPQVLCPFPSC